MLGYAVYRSDFVQDNRYVKIWQYERLAKKSPPTHENARRLRAMAEALKNGQKEYSFQTDQMPAPLGLNK